MDNSDHPKGEDVSDQVLPPGASSRESPPRLAYTIREFCAATGVSRALVYKEIKAERLKIKKVGKRTLVPIEAASAWMKG